MTKCKGTQLKTMNKWKPCEKCKNKEKAEYEKKEAAVEEEAIREHHLTYRSKPEVLDGPGGSRNSERA